MVCMKTPPLPAELQVFDDSLRALKKPSEPRPFDTVKASETAFDDETILGWKEYLFMPWWDSGDYWDFDPFESNSGHLDYAIGVPLFFLITGLTTSLFNFSIWIEIVAIITIVLLLMAGLLMFHIKSKTYITMFVYNRVFRKNWMDKTRFSDEANYRQEVESYPHRLREYEQARAQVVREADKALKEYNSTHSQRYKIGEKGLEPVA